MQMRESWRYARQTVDDYCKCHLISNAISSMYWLRKIDEDLRAYAKLSFNVPPDQSAELNDLFARWLSVLPEAEKIIQRSCYDDDDIGCFDSACKYALEYRSL